MIVRPARDPSRARRTAVGPPIHGFANIVGAMKSVTKMQFEQLGAHPGGAPSRPREPDFFGRNWQGVEGLDPYRDLRSRDPDRHSIALEGVRRAIGTGGAERVEPTPAEEERALAVVGHEIAGREIERGMDTTAWRSV